MICSLGAGRHRCWDTSNENPRAAWLLSRLAPVARLPELLQQHSPRTRSVRRPRRTGRRKDRSRASLFARREADADSGRTSRLCEPIERSGRALAERTASVHRTRGSRVRAIGAEIRTR